MARSTAVQTKTTHNAQPGKELTAGQRRGLVAKFSAKYGIDADKMLVTLKNTAFRQRGKNGAAPPEISNEQMFALLSVADRYGLDPFVKEIYAYPLEGGGIAPFCGVDGWISMVNRQATLKGFDFEYPPEGTDEDDQWIGCEIRRHDRDTPISIREYLSECRRATKPWDEMPRRMLRHKVFVQCARLAFGYTGIYDQDEAERIATAIEGEATEIKTKPSTVAPQATSPAAAQLTHVPLDEIRHRIDQIGIPESEFLAHFEIGALEELQLKDVTAAQEYLDGLAAG